MSTAPILRLENLTKDFVVQASAFGRPLATLRAVNGVTLDVMPGETLGIVGESGCGKTTLGRLILRLTAPSSGWIEFEGQDITQLTLKQMRPLRQQMQIVFQDPQSSLNPRMKVRDIIGEPLENFGFTRDQIAARIAEVMEIVKLPIAYLDRYPHAFSGGQRQRIGIARALAARASRSARWSASLAKPSSQCTTSSCASRFGLGNLRSIKMSPPCSPMFFRTAHALILACSTSSKLPGFGW